VASAGPYDHTQLLLLHQHCALHRGVDWPGSRTSKARWKISKEYTRASNNAQNWKVKVNQKYCWSSSFYENNSKLRCKTCRINIRVTELWNNRRQMPSRNRQQNIQTEEDPKSNSHIAEWVIAKVWVVGCWRGCLSAVRCRLAYGPADATATHCLLLQ